MITKSRKRRPRRKVTAMWKLNFQAVLSFFVILAGTTASAQIEYSADVVDLNAPEHPVVATVHASSDRRRLEIKTAADDSLVQRVAQPEVTSNGVEIRLGARGRVLLLNLTEKSSRILVPDTKTYYEGKMGSLTANYKLIFYAILHPSDVDHACGEWMVGRAAAGESCHNMGSEKIAGRDAVKYDLSCFGEICHLWIDRELHALIKRDTKWNSTELQNIQEIPQSSSLFDIPEGYSKAEKMQGTLQPSEPQ